MSSQILHRNFVLEKETTLETRIIRGTILINQGFGNIQHILEEVGDLQQISFKIFDFTHQKYLKLSEIAQINNKLYLIPMRLLHSDIILMKYILDSSQTSSVKSGSLNASDSTSMKKQRSKQRTINQVIEIVKKWRQINQNPVTGKKLNLQEAAEIIGISKKSLDDYYYQLRLGEKFGFDFQSQLNEKVGILRTFIKECKLNKRNNKLKIEKNPKKLRIIEGGRGWGESGGSERSGGGEMSRGQKNKFEEQLKEERIQEDNLMEEQQSFEEVQKNSIRSIENQFYSDFEFLCQEPQDPFLNFECDFKRKQFEDNDMSEQLFF